MTVPHNPNYRHKSPNAIHHCNEPDHYCYPLICACQCIKCGGTIKAFNVPIPKETIAKLRKFIENEGTDCVSIVYQVEGLGRRCKGCANCLRFAILEETK